MHLYYFVDDGSVGSVLFDVALMCTLLGPSTSWTWVLTVVGSVHVVDMSFDAWSIHLRDFFFFFFNLYRVRSLCELWSWPLVGSVHFVGCGLNPWWCSSTLWTCISLWPWLGPSISWIGVMTLGGVRPFWDLYKFVTLVGSVHFVDCGLNPWWGPSTLWTCISFWPWLGLSTLW